MQQEKLIESLKWVDFSELRFPMIVVYKNPKDYPDAYVARVWEAARNLPTNTLIKRETLQEIRKDIKAAGFIARFNRQQGDDPVIKEIIISGRKKNATGEAHRESEMDRFFRTAVPDNSGVQKSKGLSGCLCGQGVGSGQESAYKYVH